MPYTNIQTYMHTYMPCIHIHTYMHTYILLLGGPLSASHRPARLLVVPFQRAIGLHTYTYIHIHTHTYMHTYVRTYILLVARFQRFIGLRACWWCVIAEHTCASASRCESIECCCMFVILCFAVCTYAYTHTLNAYIYSRPPHHSLDHCLISFD